MLLKSFSTGWIRLCAALALILVVASPAAAEPTETDDLNWKHSSRDVYRNGELIPQAEVLSASDSFWAIALPDEPILVIYLGDDGPEVGELDRQEFLWAESRLTAESPKPGRTVDAELFHLPDALWIRRPSNGTTEHLMITAHQGGSGAMSTDELWSTVPVWGNAKGAYGPAEEAVDILRGEQRDIRLKIYLGTWCGDSRRSVPRLLAALEAAENPNFEVELIAVARGFTEPLEAIRRDRITNVPTVLIQHENHELGRFVERPHSDNVETDVAAILSGRPIPPKSHYKESDVLVAEGTYGLFDHEGRRTGEEVWRLFRTEEDHLRLHSRYRMGELGTAVWQRQDPGHAEGWMEITRNAHGELSRTRASFEEGSLSATTRGSEGGILKQMASLDGDRGRRAVVLSPSVAGWGLAWAQAGRPATRLEIEGFQLPGAGSPTAGQKQPLIFDPKSRTQQGSRPCDEVAVSFAGESGSLCLHPELDMPITASWGGLEARLERFARAEAVTPTKEPAAP